MPGGLGSLSGFGGLREVLGLLFDDELRSSTRVTEPVGQQAPHGCEYPARGTNCAWACWHLTQVSSKVAPVPYGRLAKRSNSSVGPETIKMS